MIAAIHTVLDGGKAFSADLKAQLDAESQTGKLTEKQSGILASVTRGLNNDDIARQLGISRSGVKKHLETIFRKLGVANRAEAAAYALRNDLL